MNSKTAPLFPLNFNPFYSPTQSAFQLCKPFLNSYITPLLLYPCRLPHHTYTIYPLYLFHSLHICVASYPFLFYTTLSSINTLHTHSIAWLSPLLLHPPCSTFPPHLIHLFTLRLKTPAASQQFLPPLLSNCVTPLQTHLTTIFYSTRTLSQPFGTS